MNKPTRRRQNRRKNGNDSSADVNTQTDDDEEVQNSGPRQQTSLRAVSLDRDVHGYSSSSVDNGEPQTPSPQSIEALPVTTDVDVEGSENAIDPHFARLLNGLTLSASKPALNGDAQDRATSITPTSAQSSLPSAKEGSETNTDHVMPDNGDAIPSSRTSGKPSGSSGAKSPLRSYRSDSSVVAIRPQSTQPVSSATMLPSPASDRHRKHLALLESVAQELALSTPSSTTRQFFHPGQPSSVPPMLLNPENSLHSPAGTLQANSSIHPVPLNPACRPPAPVLNDSFVVRPMTSQGLFPPSPNVRHHGPNMSMHQDSLLSILTGPSHPTPRGPDPFRGPVHGPAPYMAGPARPLPFPPPVQSQALVPQPLRIMPPPPGSFHLNPGPLTAPLASPGMPQPPIHQHGLNMTNNAQKTSSPNASQLLSLLNSNTTAKPTTTNAIRPNFPTGAPTGPPH